MTPPRIFWDRARDEWVVFDRETSRELASFPSLVHAEQYVLGLPDKDDAS